MNCFVYLPRGLLTLLTIYLTFGLGTTRLNAQIITTVAGNGTDGFSGDGGLATNAGLSLPYGVAVDAQGNLFIADVNTNSIRKVTPNGIITTVAGISGPQGFSGDGGPATQASLYRPASIALDGWGNLYISDTNNGRVFKVDHTGIIRTVAGNGTHGFNGDGLPATRALLTFPEGITVDVEGNLFISDSYNYRIRKVDRSGMIATVAGSGVAPGYGEDSGLATNANLNQPTGVTLDAAGNLFIADKANHRIRKVTAIAPALVVTSFILINANTRQEIKTILPGETINLATLPQNLNIRANTSPATVGSVRMVLKRYWYIPIRSPNRFGSKMRDSSP
ncbi:NHL repeat-containing protein [Larkinella arboricola]|uniref:NHL repeat-containing protein n=1 Tax=Larkinella arboricola TaxID=643671 RepID=A0A327WPB1_LARAB|nr:hypothetical protein [Larkinella arboricola]RAJ92156.1 NHL repeat-containing protein [Larkinella arboricola]